MDAESEKEEGQTQVISPKGIPSEENFGTPTFWMRIYFSGPHLVAAAHFAKMSATFEEEHSGAAPLEHQLKLQHRAYVAGSVMAAFSYLEATINELFADAAKEREFAGELEPEVVDLMGEAWKLIERKSTLDKFQLALLLARKPRFATNAMPYQDIDCLRALRNYLVHFKPESFVIDSGGDPETDLGKRLRRKFPLNPLVGNNSAFFPDKCLGSGCANWAVNTSILFTEEFYQRMGLTLNSLTIRPILKHQTGWE